MSEFFENLAAEIGGIAEVRLFGRVVAVQGLLIECIGLQGILGIGGRCRIAGRDAQAVTCEAVGFREDRALLMPFEPLEDPTLAKPRAVGGREIDEAADALLPRRLQEGQGAPDLAPFSLG